MPRDSTRLPSTRKTDGVPSADTSTVADASESHRLSAAQVEIVELCADAVQQLGLSRSVGQIFGVIYGSPRPLAFADVVALLGISNGSASQGLRFLRELGAVRLVDEPEGRRELFVPETELRRLLGGVLKHRFRDPLEAGEKRLEQLEAKLAVGDEPDREFLEQRVDSLRVWHRKALHFLPLLQTFLGRGSSEKRVVSSE
jgi:DNA-binding transcriptional regulator GbsR (MarR family)